MTSNGVFQEGKMALKHVEERFQVDKFIVYYNKRNGMEYQFKCRPEDKTDPISKQINGTYDFLYQEQYGRDPSLAVELGGIYKSEADMRDSNIYANFVEELRRELSKEFTPTKEYIFNIDFNRVPLRDESTECKARVTELLKWMTTAYENIDNPQRIVRTLKLNDTLRVNCSLSVVDAAKPGILILSNTDGGYGIGIGTEIGNNALRAVILDNNAKLAIPKEEGKKTILLAINSREGHSFPEPNAMKLMVQEGPNVHKNIDEIYLLNRKIKGNDFDIDKIK